MSDITVRLVKGRSGRWRRRPQAWRWEAAAGNGKTLAVSSEAYTNAGDVISAIWALFGTGSSAVLVNSDGTSFVLRSVVE
jgi:uncharacterized protein YegP (UPF0339 family)